MTVAELSSLPRGRVVIKRSGAPATLARTLTWQNTEHADAVWLSLDLYDPSPASQENAALIVARDGADEIPLVKAYRAAGGTASADTKTATAEAPAAASRWIKAAQK